MKTTFIALMLGLMSQAFAYSQAPNYPHVSVGPAVSMTGQIYIATARFSQPLSGNYLCDGPNPHSEAREFSKYSRHDYVTWAGQKAFELAANEALSACRVDYNADCRILAASYRDIMSLEFIGYKACEATVTVRGYRMN